MNAHIPPSPCAQPHRPLQVVLIGTSLEDESDAVARAGLAVARAAGGRVHLLHVAPEEPRLAGLETGLAEDFSRELNAWYEERLRRQIERLGLGEPELAGAEVASGVPHRALVETARRICADLIVVGATGSGPFAAELLGSTADRVLRTSPCPVLLVRGELQVPPRRVLAPVDLSRLSEDAFRCGLDLLAQLARGREIEVRAVHALSFLTALELRRRKPEEVSYEEVERYDAEELRRFVAESRPQAPFRIETAVLPGEPRFEILRELDEGGFDLAVLGTLGRGGLNRLLVGSVASTVARKAPCSVLLISPEAALAEGIADAVLAQATPAWHLGTAPAS